MKVSIYSRKEMETLISRGEIENTAIISFYDPIGRGRRYLEDYAPIDFSDKCDRVVQIAIHDLDPEALSDFGLSVEAYFPEADTLAEFIYKAKEDGLDIICQCEYGQSRSAGCAAAILQHFSKNGIDVFTDYRYYPNQLVYHKVFDALEKFKGILKTNGNPPQKKYVAIKLGKQITRRFCFNAEMLSRTNARVILLV